MLLDVNCICEVWCFIVNCISEIWCFIVSNGEQLPRNVFYVAEKNGERRIKEKKKINEKE